METYNINNRQIIFNFNTKEDLIIFINKIAIKNFIKIHIVIELCDEELINFNIFNRSLNCEIYNNQEKFINNLNFELKKFQEEYNYKNFSIQNWKAFIFILSDDNIYVNKYLSKIENIYNNKESILDKIKNKIKNNIKKIYLWIEKKF